LNFLKPKFGDVLALLNFLQIYISFFSKHKFGNILDLPKSLKKQKRYPKVRVSCHLLRSLGDVLEDPTERTKRGRS